MKNAIEIGQVVKLIRQVILGVAFCSLGVYAATAEHRMVRVGVSAPLSGEGAEYGAAVRNGIELAREERPEVFAGITLAYEDNRYDAATAVTAFNKLATVDRADVIFSWGEPPLHATAAIAERLGVPLCAMSLDPIPAVGKQFVTLTANPTEQYASLTMAHLRSRGVKRIGIVVTEDPFFNAMLQSIKEHLLSGESVDVIESVRPGDQDFKAAIMKARRAQFDAIGVYLWAGQVSTFLRQAGTASLTPKYFGTDVFESRSEIALAGDGIEGAVYPNIRVPQEFLAKYQKKYGNDAQIAYAYNAYQFALTTAVVFPSGGEIPVAREIVARYRTVERAGVFRQQVTPSGAKYFEFPLTIRKVTGGGFVDAE
jgi:branched-chain amino acid transport system substrate-binding protein